MKITKDLAAKLLTESPSFREHVLNLAGFTHTSSLVEELIREAWQAALNPRGSGKIAAIKAIKEYAANCPIQMEQEFPDVLTKREDGGYYCSLLWAKEFVEEHQNRIQY